MCELFAMSSAVATEVSFSLDEFSKHGGLTDHHRDGWGIAYYSQNTARIIKESTAASNSACMNFVKNYSINSHIIMSHIRYATQGELSLRNTQPFSRELTGKEHVFIHNGDLKLDDKKYSNNRFQPMGETDSEKAFCYLMGEMATIWSGNPPILEERHQVFNDFAGEMQALGIANFIYSDSEYVYIYSDKRVVNGKSNPEKKVTLPGLFVLKRSCAVDIFESDINGFNMKKDQQHVVLVSSVPLNDENWVALEPKQCLVLQAGEIILGL